MNTHDNDLESSHAHCAPGIRRARACATLALAATSLVSPLCSGAAPARSAHDAKAREILERVVSFETSEGKGQVPAMAKYLAGELRAAGFPDADIHILPLGETASLVVRYRGDGSSGKKPIALMAHMDVVAAKREDWDRDPFTLVEEKGYFYGRGVYDVKQGVTSITSTFLRLKAEGFVPTRDLLIVFTGDEESTQHTTEDLAKNHRDLVDAEYALNSDGGGGMLDENGKPVVFSFQTAEKSYADFELTVTNPGGHSSVPRPDNAIYQLADALKRVQAYQFPVMSNDTTLAYFTSVGRTIGGEEGQAMLRFAENPHDEEAARILAGTSYLGMTRTTCVATTLRGGHAPNALPQSATANINCRIFPGVSVEEVRDKLQELAGANVKIRTMGNPTSSPASELRKDVLDAVTRAVHESYPGVPVVPSQSSGASDGIYFRAAGIPTYGVSETFIKESDEFAHGLNERLPVDSFYTGLQYWHSLVTDVAGRR
jgi:acetylornithine deacetylase/succinyl-diaminopimelate desuccinylase-like protein